jgi:hypothetical protein
MARPGEGAGLGGEDPQFDVGTLGGVAQVQQLLPHGAAPAELHVQRPLVEVRDVLDGLGLLAVEYLLAPQALYDA